MGEDPKDAPTLVKIIEEHYKGGGKWEKWPPDDYKKELEKLEKKAVKEREKKKAKRLGLR
jgi:hypothetical protein